MAGRITKKPNGKYLARLFVGYDENGKRKYWSKAFNLKREAEAAIASKLKEKTEYGSVAEPSKTLLSEYMDSWLEGTARNRVTPKTFDRYAADVERYIKPKIGSYSLRRLTPEIIQGFYNKLLQQGLSPRSVRHCHAVLHSALKQAVYWRKIPYNPASMVDLPKQKKKEMRALTQEESRAFLDAIQGDRWQVLFELLVVSGMRPSEALGLKWTDIDFESGTLTIRRTLSRPNNGAWLFADTKTKSSRRTVPVPPETVQALRDHQKIQAQEKMSFRTRENKKALADSSYIKKEYSKHNLVFCNNNGEPADSQNISNRHFKPIIKALGFDGIRMYDLRHTCATLLLQAGVHFKIVSEMLGHASVAITLDTYSHVQPGMKESASEKLRSMIY